MKFAGDTLKNLRNSFRKEDFKDLDDYISTMSGDLEFEEKGNWNKKFCELEIGSKLCVYNQSIHSNESPYLMIQLKGATVRRVLGKNASHSFQILKDGKTFWFRASSAEDVSKWIKCLSNAGARLDIPFVCFFFQI